MWVRLKSIQHVEQSGKLRSLHPGDWIDVGKQQAMLWLSRGEAEIPNYDNASGQPHYPAGELGVVITGLADEATLKTFEPFKDRLTAGAGEIALPYARTLIWDGVCKLRRELLFTGFVLLDTWQVACPLFSYDILAAHIGTAEEREQTKAVIRDLRVPVYDTRLMWVKRCDETQELIRLWRSEWKEGGDVRLAFMRAFYRVKPLMLALPVTWVNPRAADG